ncbi:Phosphoglycolate phosphatase [Saliniradius amylolyticus]|uniref:Phosphoglycolate phosphatase n=1 Tax=Saliniradius amylolyticus TaxID=2183582 RepID=A0A2S2E310_9ALTE|nr:HAD-IA family hydrolase [Saliniradius amylolyticus]AWL12031.1 Phosphoglycolate phosphatase [Saliniradius amylolyticus]
MSDYRLVIFDWDGTLMDSAGRIVSSVQAVAKRLELPVPDDEAVKEIIGISLGPSLKRLFGELPEARMEQLVSAYRDEYVELNTTPTPLFNGVPELLTRLHGEGRTLAVATGKARRGLKRVWQQTNTGHFFHGSRCGDETESKPHPQMLEQLLEELDVPVHQAVMIGDTVHDMKMAEAIGMDRIGVSFGAHHPSRLESHKPKAIVDNIDQLAALLVN